jgi:hypothetical protein
MGMLRESALLSTGPVEEGPQCNAAPMPQTHIRNPGTLARRVCALFSLAYYPLRYPSFLLAGAS